MAPLAVACPGSVSALAEKGDCRKEHGQMQVQQTKVTRFVNHTGISRLSTTWVDRRPHRYFTKLLWEQQWWSRRLMSRSMTIFAAVILTFLLMLELADDLFAQSAPPTPAAPTDPEFARNLSRPAPMRAPIILVQAADANGRHTVIELPAVADSYLASARPNQNFGADSLFLGYNQVGDNFGAQRIVLRFDIAGNIPDGATINSAQLRLRLAFSSPPNDEAMGTVLRRLASNWGEETVTWNQEPSWTDIDDRTRVGSAPDWYEWEVRDEVTAWVNGTPNYGIEIIGDERIQQRERAFYARETNTGFFPRLVVDYTVIQDDEAPEVRVEVLPTYSGRNFSVAWSGDDRGPAGIAYYDVQYRVNGGEWVDWLSEVTYTSTEFPNATNGLYYQFRARGVDEVGNVEAFGDPEAATTVDTQPPVATVNPLPAVLQEARFTVSWQGDDGNGAGVQYYDIRYRRDEGAWLLWQQQTTATSALFVSQGEGQYEFEARAVDNRGMVEEFTGQTEASVIVDLTPPFVEVQAWLPILMHEYRPAIGVKPVPTSR